MRRPPADGVLLLAALTASAHLSALALAEVLKLMDLTEPVLPGAWLVLVLDSTFERLGVRASILGVLPGVDGRGAWSRAEEVLNMSKLRRDRAATCLVTIFEKAAR